MVSGFTGGLIGGSAVTIVISAVDKYSKELKKASSGLEKFAKIAKTAGLVGAAAFTAFTIAATRAALKMKPIKDSFRKLAIESDRFLEELNIATRGTISNFELMANANKALLLGLDQEALPNLFKNAAIVGRAAGRTTTEAIEDITLGIGRQSRMILDNLGIILKAEDVYKDFAESIGKATTELTQQEKQTAFNAAAMQALQESADKLGGVIPEDAITDIQRLTKGFQDFNVAFGEAFIENLSVAMPKAAEDYSAFGRTVGAVTGSIVASVVLTAKFIGLVVSTLVLGVSLMVNNAIITINALISAINAVSGILGFGEIGTIGTIDIQKQIDAGQKLTDDIQRIGKEIGDSFKDAGKIQEDVTSGAEKQLEVIKEISKEQELVNKLQGFVVDKISGEIFNPRNFRESEFKTRGNFEAAKEFGGITITIENVIGLDPAEISQALSSELNNKLSL